jgi:signal transduction histidine kinase
VQHAAACQVDLRLTWTEDALTATMTDDGCGFELGGLELTGHYGLQNMHKRAEDMNALLLLNSRPGTGTQVSLRVPLTAPS